MMRNFVLALFVIAGLTACNNDDDAPDVINEAETITQVVLTITTSDNQQIVSTWNAGVAAPTFNLPTNTADMSVAFFDATDPNDIENITTEVIREADEHFVVYSWADAPDFRVTRATGDVENTDGDAIGIRTNLNANGTNVSNGTLEVTLFHEPETVNADCGNNSCGSVTGGETDVIATFNFTYTNTVVTP